MFLEKLTFAEKCYGADEVMQLSLAVGDPFCV
jgi:hypothetical protein